MRRTQKLCAPFMDRLLPTIEVLLYLIYFIFNIVFVFFSDLSRMFFGMHMHGGHHHS